MGGKKEGGERVGVTMAVRGLRIQLNVGNSGDISFNLKNTKLSHQKY